MLPPPTVRLTPQEMQRRVDDAQRLLDTGRAPEAAGALRPVVEALPRDPGLRQLMGQALAHAADLAGAEGEFRAALALAPQAAPLHLQLGVVLAQAGRPAEAESALRTAVATDRRFLPAHTALAAFLVDGGRAEEAVQLLEPLHRAPDPAVANAHAAALQALGRKAEALVQQRRAVDLDPDNAIAWHNLAATQIGLERFTEAEASTARVHALGLNVPETWLARGRALWGLDRAAEALAAVEQAIALRPLYLEAQRDWAKMQWALTGDAAAATRHLDAALAAAPELEPLIADRARILQYAGDLAGADAALSAAAERPGAQPHLLGVAARMAFTLDPDRAARYAAEAVAAAPNDPDLMRTLCEARLAQGAAAEAARLAESLVARDPYDQHGLALLHTAWRLTGDPRRAMREDYEHLVRSFNIDAPPGWESLPAYLADLAAGLNGLYGASAHHPIGQSLRGGAKTNQNLLQSDHPAVKAFPQAVDGPIRRYIAELGRGDDPMRARNAGRYRFNGLWSVRLQSQGFHIDHLHPAGWISSACYIEVPPAVEAGGREGWIKFGQPGMPTRPPLEAEHAVKPEPGKLVLFPSYLWHGTIPFCGDTPRLTVAFDLVPGVKALAASWVFRRRDRAGARNEWRPHPLRF